jgi:hypothetical protein
MAILDLLEVGKAALASNFLSQRQKVVCSPREERNKEIHVRHPLLKVSNMWLSVLYTCKRH